MGPDPKILDDIARMAGGAVNIVSGLHQQIREDIKARVEEMAARLDLVPREDLDQALAMIETLRKTQTELEKRIEKLEGAKAKSPKATKDKKVKTAPTAKPKTKKSKTGGRKTS